MMRLTCIIRRASPGVKQFFPSLKFKTDQEMQTSFLETEGSRRYEIWVFRGTFWEEAAARTEGLNSKISCVLLLCEKVKWLSLQQLVNSPAYEAHIYMAGISNQICRFAFQKYSKTRAWTLGNGRKPLRQSLNLNRILHNNNNTIDLCHSWVI